MTTHAFPAVVRDGRGRTAALAAVLLCLSGPAISALSARPTAETRATINISEEATTLLQRADEAIAREDWKVAIDALQRIIDLPGEHLLTSDEKYYASARFHAHRRIGDLPPEGLRSYRLLYDGEAAALIERARAAHDPESLRIVTRHYLMTSHGDDAALLLADWLIDEGHFAESIGLLRQLCALYPVNERDNEGIASRLIVCAAAMGQREQAEAWLNDAIAKADTDAQRHRLEAIRAFLAEARPRERTLSHGWPMHGGGPSRAGVMPKVDPKLTRDLPWQTALPAVEPPEGFPELQDYAQKQNLFSTRQFVTDGETLVVKGERDLIGLDLHSFELLWRSSRKDTTEAATAPPQTDAQAVFIMQQSFRSGSVEVESTIGGAEITHRLLLDTVGASLSIVGDMVLTVEWGGAPPVPHQFRMQQRAVPQAYSDANSIVAYDLATGRERWRTGASFSPEPGDEGAPANPGPVQYLSAPVPVNGLLAAPFRANTDLYLALLDPSGGEIRQQLYLCGTGGGYFNGLNALEPCVADGVVYVPTGRGMLVAVDASTWTVLWAMRYADNVNAELVAPHTWLPAAPVAVADVLLLTPCGVDKLICMDRNTGEVRWAKNREDSRYIVGASDTTVWLAGENVRCLRIEDGEQNWHVRADALTGRGVLMDDVVALPIEDGLRILNAATGEDLKTETFDGAEPLGNLLAWDTSLYNVSLLHCRKFPDIELGYPRAVQEYRSDPTNLSAAIRLAWLELLQDKPAAALDALETVPADAADAYPKRFAHLIHLRVKSMLELATLENTSPEAALKLLAEAKRIAETPDDRMTCALALGDYYRLEEKPYDACQQYLALALSDAGDLLYPVTDQLERKVRGEAIQRIADTAGALDATQRAEFVQRVSNWLNEAITTERFEDLSRLTEYGNLAGLAPKAEVLLGAWAANEWQFERAESHFRRVIRQGTEPRWIAEAAARLATIYLEPDELHQPVSAQKLIDRLTNEFAEVQLPASLLEAEAPINSDGDGPTLTGEQIAGRLAARLDRKILERHEAALKPAKVGPPRGPEIVTHQAALPLTVRDARPETMAEIVMMLGGGRKLEVYDAMTGQQKWYAELRMLGEQAVGTMSYSTNGVVLNGYNTPASGLSAERSAYGVAEGQTLVLNSAEGLHAVGLLTGRRLWSRPFRAPNINPASPNDVCGQDAWMWTQDGYIVTVDARRQLEAARIHDGENVLWRATMPKREWHYLRTRGGHVVAANKALTFVDVFRMADGRYLGQCQFNQPKNRSITVALFDEVICGPMEDTTIIARELASPGIERWRVDMPGELRQIFKPSEDVLAVSDLNGRLRLIDPATGKELLSAQSAACGNGAFGGMIRDDVLYLCGYSRERAADSEADPNTKGIAAIDMKTGDTKWELATLPGDTYLSSEVLAAGANAIPLVRLIPPKEEVMQRRRVRGGIMAVHGQSGNPGTLELRLIDRWDGSQIGETVSVELKEDPTARTVLDVQLWPEQVVVMAGSSQVRFPAPLGKADEK